MNEKIKISLPIIVEGRYDKAAICSIFDATVITTGGFALFNSTEKRALIEKLSSNGIIVLTDSDAGGRQIRSYLSSILPKDTAFIFGLFFFPFCETTIEPAPVTVH